MWFAHQGYTDFFWVSRPDARHSRNLASRPELAIVIVDSTVPEGEARPVHVEALPRSSSGAECEQGIAIVSHRSQPDGGDPWGVEDVTRRRRIAFTTPEQHSTSSSEPTTNGSRSSPADGTERTSRTGRNSS